MDALLCCVYAAEQSAYNKCRMWFSSSTYGRAEDPELVGKTAVLRWLELDGYLAVEEAATDVIAPVQALGNDQPWTNPAFMDKLSNCSACGRHALLSLRIKLFFRPVAGVHAGFEQAPGFRRVQCAKAEIKRMLRDAAYDQRWQRDAIRQCNCSTWAVVSAFRGAVIAGAASMSVRVMVGG